MTRPLEGLLVVALEQAVAAPFCTMRLADAGARVIKLEDRKVISRAVMTTLPRGNRAILVS
jgi:crotonobetainyl-CoA:carnitine CoA-transferase CaiB-like acyl-CoA transferase